MNTELLQEKCEILEKVIIELSKLYGEGATEKQKALLETMVGAAIWYLPSGNELYSGSISKKALKKVQEGIQISKLTKEHKFPRKRAGKILLSEKYKEFMENKVKLIDLYIKEYGQFNLVISRENRDLIKFQKDGAFVDDLTAYDNADIKLEKMTIVEIRNQRPRKNKFYTH